MQDYCLAIDTSTHHTRKKIYLVTNLKHILYTPPDGLMI